jgi:hypothetical protein
MEGRPIAPGESERLKEDFLIVPTLPSDEDVARRRPLDKGFKVHGSPPPMSDTGRPHCPRRLFLQVFLL